MIRRVGNYLIRKKISESEREKFDLVKKNTNILVQGIAPVDYFPSVNSMYGYNRKTGAKFLLPAVYELRERIKSYLSKKFTGDEVPSDIRLSITLGYMMLSEVERRDVDNCQKFIQDTMAEFFHFNDNRIFDSRSFKVGITNSEITKELLFFRIEKNIKDDDFIYVDLNNINII